jgi:hypothetical protein
MSSSAAERMVSSNKTESRPLVREGLRVVEGGAQSFEQELHAVDGRLTELQGRLEGLQQEIDGYGVDDPEATPEDQALVASFKERRMQALEELAGELRTCFAEREALESGRVSGVFEIDQGASGEEGAEIVSPESSRRQNVQDYLGEKLAEADRRQDDGDTEVLQGELGTLLHDPDAAIDEELLERLVDGDLEVLQEDLDGAYQINDRARIDALQAKMIALMELRSGGVISASGAKESSAPVPDHASSTVAESTRGVDAEMEARVRGFERSRAVERAEGLRHEYAQALRERESRQRQKTGAYEQAQQALTQLARQQRDALTGRDQYLADQPAFSSPLLKTAQISRQNLILTRQPPMELVREHQAITEAQRALGSEPTGVFGWFGRAEAWQTKNKALNERAERMSVAYKEYQGVREKSYTLAHALEQQALDLGEQMRRLQGVARPEAMTQEDMDLDARIERLAQDVAAAETALG